jgi:hypothetical protein
VERENDGVRRNHVGRSPLVFVVLRRIRWPFRRPTMAHEELAGYFHACAVRRASAAASQTRTAGTG